jgi:hypothetical protein
MWPIQFAFRLRISCRIFFCSLTLNNASSFLTWSAPDLLHPSPAPHFKTFQVFLIYCPKRPSQDIRKKVIETQNVCFDFFYNSCLIFFYEEFSDTLLHMYIGLHVKYMLFLSDCNETWIIWTDCRKYPSITFNSNLSSTAELFCGDGWTYGHDEANNRFSQFCNPLK